MNRADAEKAFGAPWEARAFALTMRAHEAGLFDWTEWTRTLGEVIAEKENDGTGTEFYGAWLIALERLLGNKTVISLSELAEVQQAWRDAAARTPHGQPIQLERSRGNPAG